MIKMNCQTTWRNSYDSCSERATPDCQACEIGYEIIFDDAPVQQRARETTMHMSVQQAQQQIATQHPHVKSPGSAPGRRRVSGISTASGAWMGNQARLRMLSGNLVVQRKCECGGGCPACAVEKGINLS